MFPLHGSEDTMELRIGKPFLRRTSEQVSLCVQITIQERTEEAWFSVEPEFAEYLTDDRADAFVVGFLTTAMRLGADIYCDAPITKRLYYQLTTYLIPSMAANMEIYHPISIHAPVTDVPLPCEKAVGTGWTGGVDSMYTLMTHSRPDEPGMKLTHLLVANVGTLENDHNTELLHYMAEKARSGIARELDLSVIAVDSNIQLLQEEHYLAVAAFRLPAAVLALQKLFGVFLHSGAYEFSRFAFVPENSAYYELLPLSCFETDHTVFYSTGSHVSRIQKLRALSSFPPARKYLHPCIYVQRDNCGKCGKCVRTMGALYALGKLEDFEAVFDAKAFYQNKTEYLANILAHSSSQHYGEILAVMKRRGIELPPEALRLARIRRAAAIVAQRNLKPKERLTPCCRLEKLTYSTQPVRPACVPGVRSPGCGSRRTKSLFLHWHPPRQG